MEAQRTTGGLMGAVTAVGQALGPITNEIMDRTGAALDTANEVSARLFQLRDRLFGSPNPGAGGPPTSAPVPSTFADTYRDKALSLKDALNQIDNISSELANRL